MDIAHETALNDLIRDVIDQGCAVVETRLVLRWFNRSNWGKAIWQSLLQRFVKELTERGEENEGWRLYAIPNNQSSLSLVCFNPKTCDTGEGWWRAVDQLV